MRTREQILMIQSLSLEARSLEVLLDIREIEAEALEIIKETKDSIAKLGARVSILERIDQSGRAE